MTSKSIDALVSIIHDEVRKKSSEEYFHKLITFFFSIFVILKPLQTTQITLRLQNILRKNAVKNFKLSSGFKWHLAKHSIGKVRNIVSELRSYTYFGYPKFKQETA